MKIYIGAASATVRGRTPIRCRDFSIRNHTEMRRQPIFQFENPTMERSMLSDYPYREMRSTKKVHPHALIVYRLKRCFLPLRNAIKLKIGANLITSLRFLPSLFSSRHPEKIKMPCWAFVNMRSVDVSQSRSYQNFRSAPIFLVWFINCSSSIYSLNCAITIVPFLWKSFGHGFHENVSCVCVRVRTKNEIQRKQWTEQMRESNHKSSHW